MLELLLAFVIPFLAMIIVTRVTFSVFGGVIVTCMIAIFVLNVHMQSWFHVVLAVVSLVLGVFVARKQLRRKPGM
ncbi:DUF2198 family protein [Bacillus suaedae]|uniref:DUF2198 family protein n=1 Tax=Halalkalibacter suaedae TaxID=2822140 RepID=A0A940WTN5_9BACI|nr:DUF2198 family protein [Bacillus suaedae]MBP3949998.1 DUF2198 family protein [Bacillus suaedae]